MIELDHGDPIVSFNFYMPFFRFICHSSDFIILKGAAFFSFP
jgi:hypothetical protein